MLAFGVMYLMRSSEISLNCNSQNPVTKGANLWGRLATCGGLVTRLPAFANGRPATVANRRAGYHPAPPRGKPQTAYFAQSPEGERE